MSVESAMLVARLVSELGEVSGRKRLQKIVHLLQSTGAKEFGYRFILHYFGPYSKELANDLDFLSDVKILDERPPVGGENSYKYAVCAEVMDEVNRMSDRDEGGEEWKKLALELKVRGVPFLEALSTIVFLSKRGRQGTRLRKEFDRIKPNLSDRYDQAVEFANKRGFVSESATT